MNTETAVFVAIQEYLAAREAGRPIDRADLVARHPHVAQALTRCLDALEFVQGMTGDGPAPGTPFGEFVLLGEIGRGGMGVVYEAEQPALGRRVALKVLPGAAALDDRQRQRFLNEARAAAGLHHPHIVPVHAVGEANGTPYFAMQKIDGRPLTGKHDPKEAARRIVQAADALAYAHAQGVIHRDVKPGNLLVEPSGHVWVVDFGLARVEGVAALSATADILGTPRYMSPEQASGAPLDHRTDQFSLALTLYEAATGRPAYDGTTREAVLRQVLTAEPPAPDVPRDLRTILTTALARDPAGRYPGCREFADDLRRYLDGVPILAKPEGVGRRVGRWAWRMRALLATGVLALLIGLGVAVGVLLVKNAEVSAAEKEARQGKKDAEEALALERAARYRLNVNLAWREWQGGNVRLARQLLADCPVAPRGWEWHHLDRLFNGQLATLPGNLRTPRFRAFSPDSRRFTLVRMDEVAVHDAWTGRLEASLPAPGKSVREAVALPDDWFALLCQRSTRPEDSATRAVYLHHLKNGPAPPLDLSALEPGWIWSVSHGGRLIVFNGRRLLVWDRPGARPREVAREGLDWQPHADPDRLIGVSRKTSAVVLNVVTGESQVIATEPTPFWRVAVSPDGRTLALATAGHLVIWREEAGGWQRKSSTLLSGVNDAGAVKFFPDGQHVAVGQMNAGHVLVLRVADGQRVALVRGHDSRLSFFDLSPDGSRLLTVDGDGEARLWDPARRQTPTNEGPVSRLAFSPDGGSVAAFGQADGMAVERTTGRVLMRTASERLTRDQAVWGPTWFAPDGLRWMASDGQIRSFDARTWEVSSQRPRPVPPGTYLASVEVSPDGRHFTAEREGRLGLYADDGQVVWEHDTGRTQINCVAFSPDGRYVASCPYPKSGITVRRVSDGAVVEQTGELPEGRVSLAFSPDGERLAARFNSGAVEVRRRVGLEVEFVLGGQGGFGGRMAFSPDGRRLVAGRRDASGSPALLLIDVASGRELLTLPTGRDVTGVAFSPDGTCLAVGLQDGRLLLWEGGPRPSVPE